MSQSPYSIFKDWLLGTIDELPDHVKKAINPKSVLQMFGSMGDLTIFLNEYFNNYNIMSLDQMELYGFLKEMVKKHKVNKYGFSFFYSTKQEKDIKELRRLLPHLKFFEISELIEKCKENEEDDFLSSLGLKCEPKIKKLPKKKKDKTKIIEETTSFDEIKIENVYTFDDWSKLFTPVEDLWQI